MKTDSSFLSSGIRCAAWHYQALDRGGFPRPCVVLGHAFGGTRDSGLHFYAEQLSAAGYDALVFDFRHLGASDGEPRQIVSPQRQLEDLRAAVAHARTLPGVDREGIVLWGMSLSGGQVITLAVEDSRIAAVISVVGSVDMLASTVMGVRRDGPLPSIRLTIAALKDAVSNMFGRPPVYIPIFGEPGTLAMVTASGAARGMFEAAGPTWENKVAARAALEMSSVRPIKLASDMTCPVFFQIGDLDQVADPKATTKAAFAAPGLARVRRYPCDHLDPLNGFRDAFVVHEIEFLDSVFGARAAAEPESSTQDATTSSRKRRTGNRPSETAK